MTHASLIEVVSFTLSWLHGIGSEVQKDGLAQLGQAMPSPQHPPMFSRSTRAMKIEQNDQGKWPPAPLGGGMMRVERQGALDFP
jgi:hypothetical protein